MTLSLHNGALMPSVAVYIWTCLSPPCLAQITGMRCIGSGGGGGDFPSLPGGMICERKSYSSEGNRPSSGSRRHGLVFIGMRGVSAWPPQKPVLWQGASHRCVLWTRLPSG
ncbi:hypothetical protein KIL84_004564 [Mauremys mutica]|uniref:Secreted protein n=1 Tax=Mauremys mutica TaxID=74926 RepID=A0A9D4B051_9SAUR|nr:hypothetical protein KIL84_004564 [Mauremys mutica]